MLCSGGQKLIEGEWTLPAFLDLLDNTVQREVQGSDYSLWKTFHDGIPAYWDEIENGSGFADVPAVRLSSCTSNYKTEHA